MALTVVYVPYSLDSGDKPPFGQGGGLGGVAVPARYRGASLIRKRPPLTIPVEWYIPRSLIRNPHTAGWWTRCYRGIYVRRTARLTPPPSASRCSCLIKTISVQICQLDIYFSQNKGQVDGFVRELTFAKRLYQHFL